MSLERSLLGGSRTFQTDSNRWMTYTAWPPAIAKITHLYLRSDGTLSFTAPAKAERPREYISVPANPVPYRAPPIPTIYLPSPWRPGKFQISGSSIIGRCSCLHQDSSRGRPCRHWGGRELWASSCGMDLDFVVKLIDIFPERGQKSAIDHEAFANPLNGSIRRQDRVAAASTARRCDPSLG